MRPRTSSNASSSSGSTRTTTPQHLPQPISPPIPSQTPSLPFKTSTPEPAELKRSGDSALIQIIQSHSILTWWAIWGLLTRLGLNAIGEFEQRSVFSVLLVQVVGCLIMGLSLRLKDLLDEMWMPHFRNHLLIHTRTHLLYAANCWCHEESHPLCFLGLTTGYCGSVTTFSTWMIQVFQAFSNSHRSRFHSVRSLSHQTDINKMPPPNEPISLVGRLPFSSLTVLTTPISLWAWAWCQSNAVSNSGVSLNLFFGPHTSSHRPRPRSNGLHPGSAVGRCSPSDLSPG